MKQAMTACLALILAGAPSAFGEMRPPLLTRSIPNQDAFYQDLLVHDEDPGLAFIKAHAFSMLRPEHQALLFAMGEAPKAPGRAGALPDSIAKLPKLGDAEYQIVRRVITRERFHALMPVHQHALVSIMEAQAEGREVPAFCFSPGTEPELVDAFNAAVYGRFNERFKQGNRWASTASGSTGSQGDRITLTYSFVPDGTTVPTLTTGVNSTSNLFAFMNARYSSVAQWQAIYAQVFTRWSQLIGVTYVFEPNDDGAAFGASGQIGVRGDCRFSGAALDGPSNVLAFNYFPSAGVGGDMVIDTADTFFDNTGSSSLRLRNVLAHEHGHGLGMAHVCPVTSTKLMEPFVSLAYDGPQFDDILNGQRHYGDTREPNDIPANAALITDADATSRTLGSVSIDDNSDTDMYKFTVASPGVLSVTARPVGTNYLDGAQNSDGSCSAGVAFDAIRVHNLSVSILASDGASVLASANVNPAGIGDTAIATITSSGTFYARVNGDSTDNIQAYELVYSLRTTPTLVVTFPSPPPTMLSPSATTSFTVRIQASNETIVPGSPTLFYRYTGPTFQSTPLIAQGGDLYTAVLPAAPCGVTASYYVAAAGATVGTITLPSAGAAAAQSASVGTVNSIFTDDFETNKGWTFGVAGDTATSGQWIRATPVGTDAQPSAATSGVTCAVTGNATAGAAIGTNDVDNGFTTLLSPKISFPTGTTSATISYQRWFSNNAGTNPSAKIFKVEVSGTDGSTWQTLETVGPSGAGTSGSWIAQSLALPAAVLTPNFRIRFIADDTGTGSLVEAAVDDVSITTTTCTQPQTCRVDVDGSGGASIDDIFVFINRWFANDPRADFDDSSSITIDDIFIFINAWFAGC
jgi:hypothetical protein